MERLKQHGIKPSMHRIAIMDYMMTHYTHPTIDEIFNALHESIPTLSKTTVYNTLKLLSQQGIITEINIDDKNIHYDGNTAPHAHFKCRQCNKIFDLPLRETDFPYAEQPSDFVIEECQVHYKGYCNKCRKR